MPIRIVNKSLIITLLLCSSFIIHAQKVGLVLSGGAAKGIAHIGVMKALEENNIPIDYVVGTSMGAVVGSLYAAGFSPEEIEIIVTNPNFEDWINGKSSERYQYNYTKSLDDASWITVDLLFDKDFQASISTPLANDIIINFLLNEYLGQAAQAANYNFDHLFVPFKAVAADIFSEKVVRLDTGSLMQATRSSMAVPFFYRPIKFQNQYIFDGGVYDNFPVDIMKEDFKPEVTIGSNVATKKAETYPFDADEEILTDALLFLFLNKTDPSQLDSTDIYLEPDMKPFTALSFDKVPELIKAGYDVTMSQMEGIKQKISRRVAKDEVELDRAEFRDQFVDYKFGAIKLFGFMPKQELLINSLVSFKDGPLSLLQIRQAYFKLVSEAYFRNIYLNFDFDSDKGYYVLEFYLKPTARNGLSVDFGGNLSTRSVSTLHFGLTLNSFNRYLNSYKLKISTGKFYESVFLGTRFNLNPRTRLFVEPSFLLNQWDYLNTDDFFNEKANPTILNRIDRKFGATVGLGSGQRSVFAVEAAYVRNSDNFSNISNVSVEESLDHTRFEAFKGKLSYERNSLNAKQFATSGVRLYASANTLLGQLSYTPGSTSVLYRPNEKTTYTELKNWLSLELYFEEYKKISENYRVGWKFESVYSNQPNFINYQSSLVYATQFNPMFDSETYFLPNYRAYSYIGTGMVHSFHLANSLFLRAEVYGFSAYNRPQQITGQGAQDKKGFDSVHFLGMAGLIYNSVLGPLTFRLNYLENPTSSLGLSLSFGYMIFNQRSIE
ncbi:patatin-like phospholipase family protein [Roseivirga sp.]|uniref:patatin-like phospholipase family protein n=1 Tax=Roseivirga sp. TaxID=1964215 RepID=UPI002B2737D2|nr:patatin-like phospholipase family protein [Roseivirga sp.]